MGRTEPLDSDSLRLVRTTGVVKLSPYVVVAGWIHSPVAEFELKTSLLPSSNSNTVLGSSNDSGAYATWPPIVATRREPVTRRTVPGSMLWPNVRLLSQAPTSGDTAARTIENETASRLIPMVARSTASFDEPSAGFSALSALPNRSAHVKQNRSGRDTCLKAGVHKPLDALIRGRRGPSPRRGRNATELKYGQQHRFRLAEPHGKDRRRLLRLEHHFRGARGDRRRKPRHVRYRGSSDRDCFVRRRHAAFLSAVQAGEPGA